VTNWATAMFHPTVGPLSPRDHPRAGQRPLLGEKEGKKLPAPNKNAEESIDNAMPYNKMQCLNAIPYNKGQCHIIKINA